MGMQFVLGKTTSNNSNINNFEQRIAFKSSTGDKPAWPKTHLSGIWNAVKNPQIKDYT